MELLDQLGINLKVLVVQIVAFILLFWILKKFLFGRIVGHLQSRSDEIKNTFAKIEADKTEIERLTKEYQDKLANIEKEAYAKFQEAAKKGVELKNEILQQAQQQAQKELEKARAEIEREKDKAKLELRQEVVKLSLIIAEKLVDATMDEKTNSKLVEKFLNEVSQVETMERK